MSKYLTGTICVIGLIFIVTIASFAQSKKIEKESRGERLINDLVNSKTRPFFSGGSIYESIEITPEVSRLLQLGRHAIPLLIKHLDDRRILKNPLPDDGKSGRVVTVGEGALEILTFIIRLEARFFDMKCIDDASDGPDAPDAKCAYYEYSFGRRGKRNWLRAYRAGKIHYQKYKF